MVRTRFAPSPTGFMHIGNLRTAIFTYLIAKGEEDGVFILRIEDTDRERYKEGAEDVIYNTLKTIGLMWDEGPLVGGNYGPYVQSERKNNYMVYARELVEKGHAYYCFCDEEKLALSKERMEKDGLAYKYEGFCRGLSLSEADERIKNGEKFVVRFKIPQTGITEVIDEVYGKVTVKNSELEDFILIKSDGMPTYNFANVIDDHEMEITHVVRGNEYISSSPKYNLIYSAFGWEVPKYVHVVPIMKSKSQKLSKRHGDASFDDLIASGFLKEAIVNYVVLLGWSPGGEEEIFSLDELKKVFSIKGLSKSPAIFDEEKLKWMNGIYIRKHDIDEITDMTAPFFIEKGLISKDELDSKKDWLRKVVAAVRGGVSTLKEIPEHAEEFFGNSVMFENKEAEDVIASDTAAVAIGEFKKILEGAEVNEEFCKIVFKEIQKNTGVKGKELYMPIRVALTGKCHGPEMNEILDILGKENMLERLKGY